MMTTGQHSTQALDEVKHDPGTPRWLARTEEGFHRVARLVRDCCAARIQEDYALCAEPSARSAVQAILSAPSAAFAVADLHMWMGETFSVLGGGERPPWRQVAGLQPAIERVSRLVELVALAARGEGTIAVPETPYSVPGLDVRIDEAAGDVFLRRSPDGWRSETGLLPRVETFQVYGSDRRVDGDLPWITHPALMLRAGKVYAQRVSTAQWVWGAALREAADLIERGLGEEGRAIAASIHTIVPVDVEGFAFNSWTSTVVPGAIYVTRIQRPFVLAELIVHEAAHTWLSELDYARRTTSEAHADVRMYSPFRKHDRPAYAVLHGVVAHAWVSRLWRGLRDSHTGAHSFLARMRCDQVDKLVHEGIESLEGVREAISPFGWELVDVSQAR